MKRSWLLGAAMSLLFLPDNSLAQCTLVCNNQVNVSIPMEGFAIIDPDMMLEGNGQSCPGPKMVEVYAPSGANMGDTIPCQWTGFLLMVSVIDLNSGNSCWGSVLVEDKLPPLISCPDITVACTANLSPAAPGAVSVVDNCDSNPLVTSAQYEIVQACGTPFVTIIYRTWYASDANGNISPPCQQVIRVARPALSDVVFPPNRDNVQAPALPCGSANTGPAHTGYPTIGGDPVVVLCKINIEYQDQNIPQCGGSHTILRKWKAIDCCTNEILEHTQIILVQDIAPPTVACPGPLTVGTNGPGCAATFMLPPVQASDNCSNPLTFKVSMPGVVINGNGGIVHALPIGQYTVTYEVKDACQNIATCTVALTVVDDVAPAAICDKTTVVALNNNGIALVWAEVFDDGSYDTCCPVTFEVKRMEDPDTAFGPSVLFHCGDVGDSVMVVLKVKDCNNNENTCMVLAIVQDKTPPVIHCPPPLTLPCDTPRPLPLSLTGEPQVIENCTIDTLFFNDVENLNMCLVGTIARTFTVIDGEGFQATCQQVITLVDNTPVHYFFPPDTAVDCSVPLDSISAGQAVALADCELIGLNISDEIFYLPCGLKIFRTYKFKDWCSGFDTSYTQLIVVDDVNPPVWDVPLGSEDRFFLCEGDFVKPQPPTATDYCTPSTVELVSEVTIPGDCQHRFVRILTYEAADTCGNVAEPFVITLTVNDTVPPTADPLPDLGPFNCFSEIPLPNPLDVQNPTDNCINPVTVTFVSDTGNPGCSGTVVRTYRLSDVCGNEALITQNILINDTLPPTANPLPILGPFACYEDRPAANVAHVLGEIDNCGGPVEVAFVGDTGNPGCTGTVTRTYSLTDICGNTALLEQTILINDNVPPILAATDMVMATVPGLSCQTFVNVNASAIDNCPGRMVAIVNDFNAGGGNASGVYPVGTTLVTFTATDECGNVTSAQTTVVVKDQVSPSVSCMPFELMLDGMGMAVVNTDTLIKQGIIGAMDLCTEVTLTFTPDTLDCSFMVSDPTIVLYTLTATDAFGNMATCTNDIVLYDPENFCMIEDPIVAGMIWMGNYKPMPDVEVWMEDSGNKTITHTAPNGLYIFDDLPLGASCMLYPYKNDGLLNGVTTFDIVLLTRHILGIQLLDSPYKIIAADVNNSGAVTTSDAVALRRAVLQMTDEFPNNTSWRFIRSGHVFPDPANPFLASFPENAWLPNIVKDVPGVSFIAVKVGDLNNSATIHFDGDPTERGGVGEFTLITEGRFLKKGETAIVPVLSDRAAELAAMQFTLQYDSRAVSVQKITGGLLSGLDEKNFARLHDGSMTFSWDTPLGQSVVADEALFFIEISAYNDISLEDAVIINSTKTPAIAYDNGGNPLSIGWRIREVPQTPADAAKLFSLSQNRPNPFRQETRIGFELALHMPVRLEVMDMAGRKWQLLDAAMEAGRHEVMVEGGVLGSPGIYMYQIVTPYGTEQRKMIVQ